MLDGKLSQNFLLVITSVPVLGVRKENRAYGTSDKSKWLFSKCL